MNRKHVGLTIITMLIVMLLSGIGYWFLVANSSLDAVTQPLLQDANKLVEQKQFKEAITIYNEVIGIDDKNVNAYAGIIHIYVLKGRLDDADSLFQSIKDLQKHASLTEADIQALNATALEIGNAWNKAKKYEKAYEYYKFVDDKYLNLDAQLFFVKDFIRRGNLNKAENIACDNYEESGELPQKNDLAMFCILLKFKDSGDVRTFVDEMKDSNVEWRAYFSNLSEEDLKDSLYIDTLAANLALNYH